MPASQSEIPSRRRSKGSLVLLLVLPLSLYVGLGRRLIGTRVGYEMDEALYVQSAVFMLRGSGEPPFMHNDVSWITLLGRRLPLMIIPYVGTLKAYVALPLLVIFGISAGVARFSGVLLGSLGIAGLVVLIGTKIRLVAALILGVALAIHPSYLDLTVFDNGGASVWMAVMGLGALALTNHLNRRSALSAFLLGIVMGVGVWARANVLWLIASVIAAALVIFGRRAIPARPHRATMTLGAFLGAFPLILYEVASRLETLRFIASTRQPWSVHRIVQRFRELSELMISDGEQRAIWWGPPLGSWEMALGVATLVLVVISLFVRIRSDDPEISRWRRAFALSAALLSLIMLTSGLGISQHHLVAVLPLALASLTILGVEVVGRFRGSIPLLAPLAAGLAVLFLSRDIRMEAGLRRTGGHGVWSSGLDDVRGYLESRSIPPSRLKILDWGFQNNLYVASGGSVYGTELFWTATKERSGRGMTWESEIHDGGSFLLFLFPTRTPGREGFSKALEGYGGPRQEEVFFEKSGSRLAVIIDIPPTR